MELSKETPQSMSPNTIYEFLKANIDNIYQLYSYLNISTEDYKKVVLKEITNSKCPFSNDEEYLAYMEEQIKKSLDEKVKEKLKNKKDSYSVINNYIKTNFTETQSYQEALTYFNQLDKFFQKYYYFPNMNLWIKLIEENTRVFQMINLIMEHFHTQITEGKASTIFNNDTLSLALEIYCTRKNIKISNTKTPVEENILDKEKKQGKVREEILLRDSLKFYHQEIRKIPLLSPEEEKRLITLVKQNDAEAKELFIMSNLRLVESIAKRYKFGCTSSLSMLDLIQEGNLGLIKAVDKFDPNLGYKFSTYATWCIRQAITKALGIQSRNIKLPGHLNERIISYKKTTELLKAELGRNPTDEEIAQEMKLPVSKVIPLSDLDKNTISLYTKIRGENEIELGELICNAEATPEQTVLDKILREQIKKIIDSPQFSEKEKEVIRLRFGFGGREILTQRKIGEIFGCSQTTIKNMERKIKRKILDMFGKV